MKHARIPWMLLGAFSLFGAAPLAASDASPTFDSYWHDGKAELDGYRYTVTRYGQSRNGQCTAVYVTEPFSRSKRVKVDDPARDPSDVYDVLKLNLIRDFQTGIYDYNTMASLFVRSADFEPVKISFASMEWCGNVYEEIRVDPGSIQQALSSYFEGESAVRDLKRPMGGGIFEEELFVLLRGLRGEYLRPGEKRSVPFLPSAFHRRLAHLPLQWSTAMIERLAKGQTATVPAGTFPVTVYVVTTADGRVGRFQIETDFPRRIVEWKWSDRGKGGPGAGEGAESAALTGSARLEYWKLHANGDERALRQLGLRPPAR